MPQFRVMLKGMKRPVLVFAKSKPDAVMKVRLMLEGRNMMQKQTRINFQSTRDAARRVNNIGK